MLIYKNPALPKEINPEDLTLKEFIVQINRILYKLRFGKGKIPTDEKTLFIIVTEVLYFIINNMENLSGDLKKNEYFYNLKRSN